MSMLKKTLILLSLATIFPSMAERSGTLITQVDMTQDSAKEYQSAKKTLNETYQKVSKAVKGEQKTLLKKSQDAWKKYRDSACRFSTSGSQGGSAYAMIYESCLAEKNHQREVELKNFLICPEGDLSCPFVNSNLIHNDDQKIDSNAP